MLLIFVGVPFAMLRQIYKKHRLTLRLRQEGVHAQGTVLSAESDEGEVVVDYFFFLPDGSRLQNRETITSLANLHPGAHFDILYLPEDPSQNQPRDGGVGLISFFFYALFVCVFIIMVVVGGIRDFTHPKSQQGPPPPQSQLREFEPQPFRKPPPSKGTPPLSPY
ncbi:hypothetical protein G4177_19745 [Corallococcus sp. ZKHCc1 1396]|uniref:DUF3592 domain-containing protein n=1 Tax=Corallococcus soli TaxID=2710757 RepID=A0ABR9PR55_9BACT|nr:DUF3592 domain-containing protein [Corallococcus soli]MBE4750405.1 hypothetical protein [Corallococcus soli]